MHERREFVDYVVELLGPFGTVRTRRMFGGHAVYLDGLVFAIVVDEALWFKADDINRGEFEAAGCDRFSYARGGRLASMNFYRAPADAMESPSDALPWARTAYAAALRANAKRIADEQRRATAAVARTALRARPDGPATSRKAAAGKPKPSRAVTSPGAAKSPKRTAPAKAAPRATPRAPARGARAAAKKRPTRHRARRG